jgi:glycosyltransferase involved in cell wall biosynthesis
MDSSRERPKIICLTPVKNESWILDRFLKAASLWADHIIIADQMSTDGSREICKKHEKVILVDNNSETFNEPERQKLLINEARKIQGPRLLITLDADEIFTPNVINNPEWETILSVKVGTIIEFQWANLYSDLQNMWLDCFYPWGYMDDGAEHIGNKIHSARIPIPRTSDRVRTHDIKVLHFQYTDWNRMAAKHRWYQCFELVEKVNNPIAIFRRYHHMYDISSRLQPIPQKWISGYSEQKIDITSVFQQTMLPWEKTVLDYMDEYGISYFRHLNIWEINWCMIAQKWERPNPERYKDPRRRWEKAINRWLIKTQKKKNNFWIQQMEKLIGLFY